MVLEIEEGLRLDAFEVHHQPIVAIGLNGGPSVEALMRWRHPTRGMLAPGAFQEEFSDPAVRAALGMMMLERIFAPQPSSTGFLNFSKRLVFRRNSSALK